MLKAKKCKNEALTIAYIVKNGQEIDRGIERLKESLSNISFNKQDIPECLGKAPTCGPDFTPEEFQQIKAKRMRYILHLTQEEITILWGLLNDNKGNLCYAQLLAKVEQLRPQGGFYDPHNTQQKRKV